jgi:LemA protein
MSKSSLPMTVLAVVIAVAAYVYVDGRAAIVESRSLINDAWADAAEVIGQRSQQVPPLAMRIRDMGFDEGELLQELLEARAELDSTEQRPAMIAANRRLSDSLAAVLAITDGNTVLERSADLSRQQDQLAATENQLAIGRRRYNQAVQDYNTSIQLFPSNLIAGLAGFSREEAYFRTTEQSRQAPPPLKFSPDVPEPEVVTEE